MFKSAWKMVARWYQGRVTSELKKFGLRYDDLIDENFSTAPAYKCLHRETDAMEAGARVNRALALDLAEAYKRLPLAERDARNQRLKRAMDVSMKHIELPKELQDKQTPLAWYFTPVIKQVRAEMAERAALGTRRPYDRSLP